jgi:hypothetical protein
VITGESRRNSSLPLVRRRSFLRGGAATVAGAGAVLAFPGEAAASSAADMDAARLAARSRLLSHAAAHSGTVAPVPPSIRSLRALGTATPELTTTLPLTQGGTTYDMAQEVVWLDGEHFAVGRWDGTMSLFDFETAPFVGPMINTVVNSPAYEGVQMITKLPRYSLVTSNDSASLAFWTSRTGSWTGLRLLTTVGYDSSLGVATNGAWLPVGPPSTLVVGHVSGYLSLWSYDPNTLGLKLVKRDRSGRLRRRLRIHRGHPERSYQVTNGLQPSRAAGDQQCVGHGKQAPRQQLFGRPG